MTRKQQEQQLREELLIEFEFTAPTSWNLQKLQAEIDKRRAEQAEEETKQGDTPPTGTDDGSAAAARKAEEDAKAAAAATKAEEDTKAAAVAAKAQEDAKAAADADQVEKDAKAAADADKAEEDAKAAANSKGDVKPGPNTLVLMVTTLAHEYVDETARNKRSVRVKGENFYTNRPEDYAGAAEVVAELAEDE